MDDVPPRLLAAGSATNHFETAFLLKMIGGTTRGRSASEVGTGGNFCKERAPVGRRRVPIQRYVKSI